MQIEIFSIKCRHSDEIRGLAVRDACRECRRSWVQISPRAKFVVVFLHFTLLEWNVNNCFVKLIKPLKVNRKNYFVWNDDILLQILLHSQSLPQDLELPCTSTVMYFYYLKNLVTQCYLPKKQCLQKPSNWCQTNLETTVVVRATDSSI